MSRRSSTPSTRPQAIGTYSQAVRVGDTVYVSGQIPLDPATGNSSAATSRRRSAACSTTSRPIAEAAGGTLAQAVKVNVFLTDLAHFAQGQRDHGDVLHASPTRRARRSASRRCRAARRSRWSASCTWAEPDRAGAVSRTEQRPVTALRGVGAALAERLARLGVTQVADLLFVLPLRYEDRTRVVADRRAARRAARAVVEGEVLLTEVVFRGRRQLLCRISDGSGFAHAALLLFLQRAAATAWRAARACAASARCAADRSGLEMVHPEYRRIGREAASRSRQTLTPIYPRTEGVTAGAAARAGRRGAARDRAHAAARTCCPPGCRAADAAAVAARRRSTTCTSRRAGTELGDTGRGASPGAAPAGLRGTARAPAVALKLRKRTLKADPACALADAARTRSSASSPRLPFRLTGAQQRVLRRRSTRDLRAGAPMTRLVQGDVGCGKTVVAAAAAARAVGSGLPGRADGADRAAGRAALRATCATGSRRSGMPVALLTGSQPARARRSALAGDRRRAGAASWSARTRCSRKASSSQRWRS